MDDVQRRLALLDAQLAGGGEFFRRSLERAPLLFAVTGLVTGILIQRNLELPVWLWIVLLLVCGIVAISLYVTGLAGRYADAVTTALSLCMLAGFCCLGAIRQATFVQPEPNDIRKLIGQERKLATIRGTIISRPCINRNQNWAFADFGRTTATTSFYIKTTEIQTSKGWAPVTGTVRVRVGEPVLDLKAGDYIQLYCWLDRFKDSTNPGQFDTRRYLAHRNIFVAANVGSREGIILLRSCPWNNLAKLKTILTAAVAENLLGDSPRDERQRGLLEALLLGHRKDLDSRTYRAFEKTGLLHLISLSGLHLGILTGSIWWLLSRIGLSKAARALACIGAVVLFLLIVPLRAPTIRAAIIAWTFCLSFLFRRRPNSLNTLSLAAIVLLLIRPSQLLEAGWQLSFASVLGILLFSDPIHFAVYRVLTARSWESVRLMTRAFYRIALKPGPYILRLLSVGTAAWLGGAGILLYHFHTITPLAPLWTVIVFPVVVATLTLGFLKMIVSIFLPTLGLLLGIMLAGLSEFLIRAVDLFSRVDFSELVVGKVSMPPVVLYYAVIGSVILPCWGYRFVKRLLIGAATSALLVFLGVTKWHNASNEELVITCLDVGHGQAVVTRLPGGANLLFDAGSVSRSNIGQRIVVPFLRFSGINRLDYIFISHQDCDHINGIPEVFGYYNKARLYASEVFMRQIESGGAAAFLAHYIRAEGGSLSTAGKVLPAWPGVVIRILWPGQHLCGDADLGDNDKSMVVLIEFAGRKVLLCSDIEKAAQKRLMALFPGLKVNVLFVPHHGSVKTLEPHFLDALNPDILICSCSRSDYEHDRLIRPANETPCFYTAVDGAITVRIKADGRLETGTFLKVQ